MSGPTVEVSSSLSALKSIKENQQRYEEQHIQQKAVGAAASVAAGDDEKARELQLQEMNHAMQRLESIVDKLDQNLHSAKRKLDDLEQHGRRNCLFYMGAKLLQ